jgi:hypothetical protein
MRTLINETNEFLAEEDWEMNPALEANILDMLAVMEEALEEAQIELPGDDLEEDLAELNRMVEDGEIEVGEELTEIFKAIANWLGKRRETRAQDDKAQGKTGFVQGVKDAYQKGKQQARDSYAPKMSRAQVAQAKANTRPVAQKPAAAPAKAAEPEKKPAEPAVKKPNAAQEILAKAKARRAQQAQAARGAASRGVAASKPKAGNPTAAIPKRPGAVSLKRVPLAPKKTAPGKPAQAREQEDSDPDTLLREWLEDLGLAIPSRG